MKTTKGLSRKSFDQKFGTNEQCMTHLYNTKWSNGFVCKRCGHNESYKGKKQFHKRCKQCGKEESAMAHTIFHKVKFDLYKAFGMLYDVMLSKKGANSIWLAERYEVSQNTAWLFRRKLQDYLKSSGKHPLTETVQVDEFEIGTPKKGQQGRANTKDKVRVVIAIEVKNGKVGNGYAQVIQDFSSKCLKTIFENHIDAKANIKTDGWTGYSPLKRIYKRLVQEKSDNGANFPEIHIQIRNLKNWLRGVHSYSSMENAQQYLDEYFYRFNRRNFRTTIMDKLFDRIISQKARIYKDLINIAT
jgi:transcription elongation factor Elf1